MELYLNDQAVEADFITGESTVEDAIRKVHEESCLADHMVVAIKCDGKDVPPDTMAALLESPAKMVGRIDVITGTKSSLVLDAMDQAATCLGDTQTACEEAASLLTEGKTAEATETLGGCMHVWRQVHEALAKSLALLGADPEQLTINDESFAVLVGRPKDMLLQIKSSLVSKDYVMLADVLQYELGDVLDVWHSLIAKLRSEAESTMSDATA